MNLSELLAWHLHNVKELERESELEKDQYLFHLEAVALLTQLKEKESELKKWVEDRQLNGDDGSGFDDYESESEL